MLENLQSGLRHKQIDRDIYPEIIEAALGSGKPILLTGPPGIGKTSSLLHLSLLISERAGAGVIKLSINEMASTPERFFTHLSEILADAAASPGHDYTEGSGAKFWKNFLEVLSDSAGTSKIILLIDDIDEILSFTNFPKEKTLPDALMRECVRKPSNLIIIASTNFPKVLQRRLGENGDDCLSDFEMFDLSFSLDDDREAEHFINNYPRAEGRRKSAADWFRFSRHIPAYLALASNEILESHEDSILALLHDEFQNPLSPLILYCRIVNLLLISKSQGYGITKRLMELIAKEEGQNLTSISGKINRDRGPTKYYLLWLMETGIIKQQEKKYYFRDHVLKEYVSHISGGVKRTEIIQSMPQKKAKPEQSGALLKPAKEPEESKLNIEADEKSEQLIEID